MPTYSARAASGHSGHWRALAKSNTSSAVAAASGATNRGPPGREPTLTWWSMQATACDCVIARARSPNRHTSEMSRTTRSEEHTSELQSPCNLVCRLLLEKKKGAAIDLGVGPAKTVMRARTSSNSLLERLCSVV